jgi:nickel superoxide dismutase
MVRTWIVSAVALTLTLLCAHGALAHCEIPCGIYDDGARFAEIEEHISTIERSMAAIRELAGATPVDYNQLTRWVTNKETHATEIQHIASQYFLTQRVKPLGDATPAEREAYVRKLTLLHEMIVTAMKAKQTTDPTVVTKLRTLLSSFRVAYGGS